MKRLKSIILLGLIALPSIAQTIDTDKLDAYFAALEQNNKFMGTVSVARQGEQLYTKSVGYADIDLMIKADKDSRYHIGSVSKTFTATMIMQAVEKGIVTLDQTLDKFFPSIENADKITISQLLYHRSGIHNFTSDQMYLRWNTEPKTQQEMVQIIKKAGSDFKPDSKMSYSNSGYVLLSYILENIYNNPYSKILEQNITEPLKLTNTSFGGRIEAKNNTCKSYKYIDGWRIEPQTDPTIAMGAGGIISTTSDLNRFTEALFSGTLISKESLALMTTIKDNYGIGLFPVPFGNKIGFGHTGGIDGFNSIFVYFPDDKTAYSLVSNGLNYIINDISIAVLSAIYSKPFEVPDFRSVNLTFQDIDKYLGVYSSSQLPIKLTITKSGKSLNAQGTGQMKFTLEPTSENTFSFDQAGIVLEFNPSEGTMILKQGGAVFVMKRE